MKRLAWLFLLLIPLAAGCKDTRIPEEIAADRLEQTLTSQLRIEQRRAVALKRQATLKALYAARVSKIRGKGSQ